MKDIKTIDSLYHACTYGRAPVVFERGRGARLWDDKGRDYIDFGSGIGVMSLGYANPEWVKAVSEQAAVLPHTSNLFYNEKTAMLAGRLALRTHFERVFCARARKWNGFSRKVERSSQLMERLMAHEFSQNGTALAPIWNDPLSNRDAPVILSQWNGNP